MDEKLTTEEIEALGWAWLNNYNIEIDDVLEAQISKSRKYYASLTSEKLMEEIRHLLLAPSEGWSGLCMKGCHHLHNERKWENCKFPLRFFRELAV